MNKAAGEVPFLGAEGSDGSDKEASVRLELEKSHGFPDRGFLPGELLSWLGYRCRR